MLNKIKIENFQSHENTEIDLSSGVNIIHGLSQAGKTAIFRALNWVFFNRPSGFKFHSTFATSPSTKVSLLFDDCKVSLQKDPKTSKYILETSDGVQELSVVGTSVPEEISKAINISELNISNQLDNPFFILNSPGEIGRIFNSITNSEKADEIVSKLTTLINQHKSYVSTLEKQALEIQTQIDSIEKLEKHDKEFSKYQILLEKQSSLEHLIEKVKSLYEQIKKKQEFIIKVDIKVLDNLYYQIIQIDQKTDRLFVKLNRLQKLYGEATNIENRIVQNERKLATLKNTFSKYTNLEVELEEISTQLKEKINLIKKFQTVVSLQRTISSNKKILMETRFEYQKELSTDGICPYCFSKINKKILMENL